MKKSVLTKTLTLTSFIVLLSGFVAFKNGSFDKILGYEDKVLLPPYSNSRENNILQVDTPDKTVKKESPDIMYSSKMMVLPEQKIKFEGDSTKKDKKETKNPKKKKMMSSSKSGIIYNEDDFETQTKDSSKQEKNPK